MKLICEIELPDDASEITILDAIASAARDDSKWKRKYKKVTDLTNKCGSCKHFCPYREDQAFTSSHGTCNKGHAWGARTRPACKDYEEKYKWQKK